MQKVILISSKNLRQLSSEYIKKLRDYLGLPVSIQHVGASALGILTKKDIDLEVLTTKHDFEDAKILLEKKYGEPTKAIDKYWVKFETRKGDVDIDIIISVPTNAVVQRSHIFFNALKNNAQLLHMYESLKKKFSSKSKSAYVEAKTRFFKRIVAKSNKF